MDASGETRPIVEAVAPARASTEWPTNTAPFEELPTKGTRKSVSLGERVRSVSAGSPDLLNVELDHAIALIAAAGEHAPCDHHWPILRKRGRGCAVATLGFTFAGESMLLLTPRGRSSAYAKSAGRDLPTDFAVGRIHRQVHHTQRPGHGPMGRLDLPLVSVSSSGFSSSVIVSGSNPGGGSAS
jgi:hypothetical protein